MSTYDFGPPAFAGQATAYIRHYRALGLHYRHVEHILSSLGRYLAAEGALDLDGLHFERWRQSRASLHSNARRKAEQIVRRFSLYRRRSEPTAFVPSADTFSPLRPTIRPVIIEPEQIMGMLAVAQQLPPVRRSPLRPAVARVATVLLYTTGLRVGELLRLRVEDIDEGGALLQVRQSKFHKSRLVPLSDSAQVEVAQYLKQRAMLAVTSSASGPFLCNRYGGGLRPYSAPGIGSMMRRLFRSAAVRDSEGRVPRIHDLRHSFAVQSLIRSYRAHGDPQALLPKLAIYLGHVSVESTMHYLKLVPAVAQLASTRFEAAFGQSVLGDQP